MTTTTTEREHHESTAFEDAIARLAIWKNEKLMDYARRFIEAGLNELDLGFDFFGSDDVKDGADMDHAIPGAAISCLRRANLIKDYFGHHPELGIHGGRRMSKRPLRNGAKVNLYSLTSKAMAVAFLKRAGTLVKPQQMELLG